MPVIEEETEKKELVPWDKKSDVPVVEEEV